MSLVKSKVHKWTESLEGKRGEVLKGDAVERDGKKSDEVGLARIDIHSAIANAIEKKNEILR